MKKIILEQYMVLAVYVETLTVFMFMIWDVMQCWLYTPYALAQLCLIQLLLLYYYSPGRSPGNICLVTPEGSPVVARGTYS